MILHTIISCDDIFNSIYKNESELLNGQENEKFSTNPSDYLKRISNNSNPLTSKAVVKKINGDFKSPLN